jgi:hypothetical protein
MLKFILLVLVFFLLFRMVLALFRRSFFFRYRSDVSRSGGAAPHQDFRKKVEEADYEVIGTQLKENDPASRDDT